MSAVTLTFWQWNEPAAILVAALVAALVAVWGILSQRAITARQTTLEYIRASETDQFNVRAREIFNKEAKNEDGLGKWGKDDHADSDEAKAIRVILNEHELIAIAIQRGILDDTTYRRYFRSGVIKTWNYAAPYVLVRRNRSGNQALYHEFEELARWYQGSRRMPRRHFLLRNMW